MAPQSRGAPVRAQLELVQLANCFVNLPAPLVAVLAQTVSNILVQGTGKQSV